MIRTFTLLILFLGLSLSLFAQCEIPNGSFENWDDLSIEIDTSGTLLPETVLLPENFSSGFRLFFAVFSQVFGAITDSDIAEDYFGIERSEDATDGNFSMKIGGNNTFPLADALTVFACDGNLPSRFSMDLRHVGTGADSLDILITFGTNPAIPQTQAELVESAGYFLGNIIVDQETPWATIDADIIDNANGMSADSVFMWFVVNGNEESIANGEESYFLIDNMSFMNESSVAYNELAEPVKVYPMPFTDQINIDNSNERLEAGIYDQLGRKVTSFTIEPGLSTYNLDDISVSGNYILEMKSKDSGERSSYNIIKK